LYVVYGNQGGEREDITGEVLKVKKFVENIRHIHLQVQDTLKALQEKYKARHDQHKSEKSV
jgi:hypothetical protein